MHIGATDGGFFDFDQDQDLDVFLLTNVIDQRDKNIPAPKHLFSTLAQDHLLENKGGGVFIDVSDSLGVLERGYGLFPSRDSIKEVSSPQI